VHRTTRSVPAQRIVVERERMRSLPERLPDVDRRLVTRVAQQPYLSHESSSFGQRRSVVALRR
jgi:hypothetical protein